MNVKYDISYDRLPRALLRLAQHHIVKRQTAETIAAHCRTAGDTLPCEIHFDAVQSQKELDRRKSELLGCVRFIASLSRVDGFVLLDRSLVVHGFGVEARAYADLTEVDVAGDAKASSGLLRKAPLSQFGTRHRAMLRYCDANEGALGLRNLARRRYPGHDETSRPACALGKHQCATGISRRKPRRVD